MWVSVGKSAPPMNNERTLRGGHHESRRDEFRLINYKYKKSYYYHGTLMLTSLVKITNEYSSHY